MQAFDPFETRLPEALRLLSGERGEEFELHKYAEFARFFAWLNCPDRAWMIELAAKVAVARALRNLYGTTGLTADPKAQVAFAAHYSAPEIIFGLLSVPDDAFSANIIPEFRDDSELAVLMARFLLQLSKEADAAEGPPSLNRAIHFVGSGGFRDFHAGASHQTLKDSWTRYAKCTPFLLAEFWYLGYQPIDDDDYDNFYINISSLPPSWAGYYNLFKDMFDEEQRFLSFLETARFLQARLIEILSPEAVDRIGFVEFPPSVKEREFLFPPFTPQQREIAGGYRVFDELLPV